MSSEGRWRPEVGDTYWYVSELGEVCGTDCDFETDDSIDGLFWRHGNCFKSEEAAEHAAKVVHSALMGLHEHDDEFFGSVNRRVAENYMKNIYRHGHDFGVNLINHLLNLIDVSDKSAASAKEKLEKIQRFVDKTIGDEDNE